MGLSSNQNTARLACGANREWTGSPWPPRTKLPFSSSSGGQLPDRVTITKCYDPSSSTHTRMHMHAHIHTHTFPLLLTHIHAHTLSHIYSPSPAPSLGSTRTLMPKYKPLPGFLAPEGTPPKILSRASSSCTVMNLRPVASWRLWGLPHPCFSHKLHFYTLCSCLLKDLVGKPHHLLWLKRKGFNFWVGAGLPELLKIKQTSKSKRQINKTKRKQKTGHSVKFKFHLVNK